MTFTSVLRLVAAWFPARRVPVVTQLTGLLGQGGQLAAAIPLVALLHVRRVDDVVPRRGRRRGWPSRRSSPPALRDAPPWAPVPAPPQDMAQVRHHLARGLARARHAPGPWTHFSTQFSGTVFALLWGYPFLVQGEDLLARRGGRAADGALLAAVAIGPVPGALRRPLALPALDPHAHGSSAASALTGPSS